MMYLTIIFASPLYFMIRMYFKIKIIVTTLFFLIPAVAWADCPQTILLLRVGQGPIPISIQNPGDVVWVRAEFGNPVNVSHITFETTGEHDTYMYFYKDLADVCEDRYLAVDDDSGEAYNARISYSIGYPSPYYLKLRMYSSRATGTFNLDSTMYYADPDFCPFAGPCVMEIASKDQPNARQVLFVMRIIRDHLLRKTESGRKAIELYYTISKDILWDLSDLRFSQRLYALALDLMPLMQELLRISLNEDTGMVLSREIVAKTTELKNMLIEKISEENARRLEAAFRSLNLEQNVGNPIRYVLAQSGYLPAEKSPLTLDEDLRSLASKYDLIVKFRQSPPVTPQVVSNRLLTGLSSVDQIFSIYSVESIQRIFKTFKHKESQVGLDRIFKIRLKDPVQLDLILQQLLKSPDVEYAEKNKIFQIQANDVYFPFQYPLENHDYPQADIRATEAWRLETGDPSILVSVVDTGIDYYHADLSGRVRVDLGYDYVNEDSDPLDDNGHGTHVAGIIGASYNNFFSIAGVAPRITIVPFKVCDEIGQCPVEDVASGIIASVDVGAKVINLSLGGGYSNIIEDALRYADENGSLAIAAAGNDGNDRLIYPASSPYTVSVGATDSQNLRASFSNYGVGLNMMAPGVDVLSLFKDGLTCYASGTSMATPHVVGVAALILSKSKSLSLGAIKDLLFQTALDLGTPGYDTDYGWGLVDAFSALTLAPAPTSRPIADVADYNGDGRADIAVYRPSTGEWFVFPNPVGVPFGSSGDIPTPGDYDGDGLTDLAVFRPSTGNWHVKLSLFGGFEYVQAWGLREDIPVPGDYNGDGKTDFAVWRPSDGQWWILFTGGGGFFTAQVWGIRGDVPVPEDYDGDGITDLAVFRPSEGTWHIVNSSNGVLWSRILGQAGDIPVPGDYDGDGLADIAVWRPGTGEWVGILKSGRQVQRTWGLVGDLPVQADYDGDGRTDLGIFRPSTGEWYILASSSRFTSPLPVVSWGLPGDIPVSASGGK